MKRKKSLRNYKGEGVANNTTTHNGGIGFTGLLTVLFIGLKLTGHITWPWLWVLSPLWISLSLIMVTLAVLFVIYLFCKQ